MIDVSRRDEYLKKLQQQKAVDTVSRIYLSSITEVLFEAGLKKEDMEYLLSEMTEKVENLTKGFIDLKTYILSVEEKTGIKLNPQE